MSGPKADIASLKKRADFLSVAATGRKWVARHLILQLGPSCENPEVCVEIGPLSYGLTASRKVGNAVVRNRARRRLRALVREVMAAHADRKQSYVLIARPATATAKYDDLRQDLIKALRHFKLWRDTP